MIEVIKARDAGSRCGILGVVPKNDAAEVRAGRRICGVFYGHPGVFAQVPHNAIAGARTEGFDALMEPGISAADCLYADLGIRSRHLWLRSFRLQPVHVLTRGGSTRRRIWSCGRSASPEIVRSAASPRAPTNPRLLVELLAPNYPGLHEVIAYEAATLPITAPRMERMPLGAIVGGKLGMQTTLVIPPVRAMQRTRQCLRVWRRWT